MTLHRLGFINKNQSGVSFIELLIAIAITVIITAAATTAIFQVIIGNIRGNNHIIAIRQVQSAGYWVSHDAQMTQEDPVIVNGPDDDKLKSIILTWTGWETNYRHQVTYTLDNDKLWQGHVIYDADGIVVDNQTGIVAQYIDSDPAKTSCNFTDSLLIFTVTATVGTGSPQGSETRVYEVIPRPGS